MHEPERIDPQAHRVLAGASRVRVLEYLRERGEAVTAAELAGRLDLHANTVRAHLEQLTDAGLVTRTPQQRPGPGRPRLLFAAVAPPAAGDRDGADEHGYRMLAGALAAHLGSSSERAADEAVGAGRAWARSMSAQAGSGHRPQVPLDDRPVTAEQAEAHVVGLMQELGFEPTAPTPDGVIDLHRCPFRPLAEENSRVVCGVHLGLVRGVLEDLGAPLEATRLEPFVTPTLCRAHLRAHPEPDGGPPALPAPPSERSLP